MNLVWRRSCAVLCFVSSFYILTIDVRFFVILLDDVLPFTSIQSQVRDFESNAFDILTV